MVFHGFIVGQLNLLLIFHFIYSMSQIDGLSNEEEQNQEQLDAEFQPKNNYGKVQKYLCLIGMISFIIFIVVIAICIIIVLDKIQTKPNITINYSHQSIQPFKSPSLSTKSTIKRSQSNLYKLNQSLKILNLQKISSLDILKIQQINQHHRIYQQSTRNLNYDNMQKLLHDVRQQFIDTDQQIKYDHYLKALKFMLLTTYPINHQENNLDKLRQEEKQYYLNKYSFKNYKDMKICVITSLTHYGLQSGNYYYLLKSIYQQNYRNYKHVVINYPKMHMDQEVNKILSALDQQLRNTIFVNLTYDGQYNSGAAIYTVLHQHCPQTDITIFLKDTGQLIGSSVFKILSQFHQSQETNIIFTKYLLTTNHFFSSNQDDLKYKIQMYPKNLSKPRGQQYKTKYLKSYRTKLLLKLPELVFQDSQGKWKDGFSQSSLQFAVLEANCGDYHLVEQLLFLANPKDIQSQKDVHDSQSHEVLKCLRSIEQHLDQTHLQQNQLRDHP